MRGCGAWGCGYGAPCGHVAVRQGPPGWLVLVVLAAGVFLLAPYLPAKGGGLAGEAGTLRRPQLTLPAPPPQPGQRGGGTPAGGRVCPVDGPVRFTADFGAPRKGHRHQGNDLTAAAGTRLVAVEAGRVGPRWGDDGGRAGVRLWLEGDSGTHYFYAHNQRNVARPGQRVRRGELLAYLGSTGNAAGGRPHLHFQVHPGGGGPVDPYPRVAAWCKGNRR